jgi:hypothetical protein
MNSIEILEEFDFLVAGGVPETEASTRVGVELKTIQTYRYRIGRREPRPLATPSGHHSDITLMRNDSYRAECTCGWWQDAPEYGGVKAALLDHEGSTS